MDTRWHAGLIQIATMAELFGKSTGVSRGKGGSMHLFDAGLHFMGGHAIVGGHLPLAAGLALSAQFKNTGAVAMAFLGDGSVNEGEFHETLNLAAVWNLPIVLVLENNLYGMGSSVERVHARGGNFDQASNPYGFDTVVVDDMDVIGMRFSSPWTALNQRLNRYSKVSTPMSRRGAKCVKILISDA